MAAAPEEKTEALTGPYTVLITGANRGIGFEFVVQYLKIESPKYSVIATCRKTSDQLTALKEEYPDTLTIYENLDVSSEENVAALAEAYKTTALDIVILNAGIMPEYDLDKFGTTTKARMMRVFEVNTVGCVLVAQALIPSVKLSSRKQMVVISSGLGSIQDNTSGGYLAYRTSKVGINAAMQDLVFREPDIHTLLLEPGFVPTELTPMNKKYATTPTEESVAGMIKALDDYKNIPNGALWSFKGTPFGSEKDENGVEKYPRGKV